MHFSVRMSFGEEMKTTTSWAALLLSTWFLSGSAAVAQSGGSQSATPQRPTFTSDASTAAPGTMELEMGTASWSGFFAQPVLLKYTPNSSAGLLHQAEFGLAFDAVSSVGMGPDRMTEFGDRIGVILRRPVYSSGPVAFAVAPAATFLLRGDEGARLGATGIAAFGFGQNGAAVNAGWSSATNSSPTNPAHDYFVAADFARTLGTSGALSRLSPFVGVMYQDTTLDSGSVSLGQGLSYRARPDWVFDLGVYEHGFSQGTRDYQFLVGFTVNMGRPGRW